jgi:hypothetical protein
MRGRTYNIIVLGLAGISLALCLGVIGLWVRSHSTEDHWGRTSLSVTPVEVSERRIGIFQRHGRFAAGVGELRVDGRQWPGGGATAAARSGQRAGWFTDSSAWVYAQDGDGDAYTLGFAAFPLSGHTVRSPDRTRTVQGWFVCVPHWFLATLFAVLPTWWLLTIGSPERPGAGLLWVYALLLGGAAMVAFLQTLALLIVVPLAFVAAVMCTTSRDPNRRTASPYREVGDRVGC